jgi:hypothetical protein
MSGKLKQISRRKEKPEQEVNPDRAYFLRKDG